MSRRPSGAASANARAIAPSRRHVLAGAAAAPLAASGAGDASAASNKDDAADACENWLAVNAEAERLQRRWGRLGSHLVRKHDWFQLSERERRDLPEARELFDVDERLEMLLNDRDAMLALLPSFAAASSEGIAAKIAVAAVVIGPDDFNEAYLLLASVLRDLKAV